jgi:hypothetical protein
MFYRYFRASNIYTYIFMLGLHERMKYFAVYIACFWSLGVVAVFTTRLLSSPIISESFFFVESISYIYLMPFGQKV